MIMFTMAGASRRFSEAGYTVPKYMLPLLGGSCFDYAVAGFREAYAGEPFVFVFRDVDGTREFVQARTRALGLDDVRLLAIDELTGGQAETVERGLDAVGAGEGEPLAVFNIDTFRRRVAPPPGLEVDGWLEVFVGSGDNWSFVKPAPGAPGRAAATAEKQPISELCCTGLYHFGRAGLFRLALAAERAAPSGHLTESYVAPLYNQLISRGFDIRYAVVDLADVRFCGVPAEYEALRAEPTRLDGFGAA